MGLEMTTIHSGKMDVKNLVFFTLPSLCNKTDITDILMWLTSCTCWHISTHTHTKKEKQKVTFTYQSVSLFQAVLTGFFLRYSFISCVCAKFFLLSLSFKAAGQSNNIISCWGSSRHLLPFVDSATNNMNCIPSLPSDYCLYFGF